MIFFEKRLLECLVVSNNCVHLYIIKKQSNMTTQEKIEKAIAAQNCLSGIEYRINGDFAIFTRPEESAKYQQVGKIRISDGKCFPFSYHTRTQRERDAVKFLEIISLAIISEKFPEEDTRPNFFIQF